MSLLAGNQSGYVASIFSRRARLLGLMWHLDNTPLVCRLSQPCAAEGRMARHRLRARVRALVCGSIGCGGMFAATAVRIDADFPLSGLELGERPEPVAPDGWTTVMVKAAALNHHDSPHQPLHPHQHRIPTTNPAHR